MFTLLDSLAVCSVLFRLFLSLFCPIHFCYNFIYTLFYSVVFYSILFCSVLLCSVLYSFLFYSNLFCLYFVCSFIFYSAWPAIFTSSLLYYIPFCCIIFYFVMLYSRAVRFQKCYLGFGSVFFGTEKPRFGFDYFQKRRTVQMYELVYVCFEYFY
jgi:hypothetical protein